MVQPGDTIALIPPVSGVDQMKAIILAGGESSRFGKAKAFAKIDNQYFYQKL